MLPTLMADDTNPKCQLGSAAADQYGVDLNATSLTEASRYKASAIGL
jgi:hypothetical protein